MFVECKYLGGLGDKNSNGGQQYYQQDRVYSMGDIALCHPANSPGGSYKYLEIKKCNYVTVPQTVKVRKYEIDNMQLCDLLRKSKSEKKLSNEEISKQLNVPITNVEHWFRRDKYFSIPEPEIWFSLKELLGIKTDKFDNAITTLEEREGKFEKSERIYLTNGVAPTILTDCQNEKVLIMKKIAIDEQNMAIREETVGCLTTDGSSPKHNNRVAEISKIAASRGRQDENGKWVQQLEVNEENVTNTITSVAKDNLVLKIRQATKSGSIPCKIGGGGRFELHNKYNTKGQGSRERRDKSNDNDGEYP